jgi:hypothetical protein
MIEVPKNAKRRGPARKQKERYPLVLPMLRTLAPDAVAELVFHPIRKWRSDFAIPSARLLIEIDGGVFTNGRHTRGAGFIEDQCKHNAAAVLGYFVLRFVPADIKSGTLIDTVRKALHQKETV